MDRFAHIVDHPELIRDMNTQAVLTTDRVAIRRHEKRMQELQREEARQAELNNLRRDMDEIKAMLRNISHNMAK